MLVHRPTLQGVEVLVQPLVPLRQEGHAALLAPIRNGPALDHPSPHPRGSEHQVECLFPPWVLNLVAAARDLNNGFRLALWTVPALDDDALAHPQLTINALAATSQRSLQRFAGADIDSLPLVVEVRALVDVCEVRMKEGDGAPTRPKRQLGRVLYLWNGDAFGTP